MSEVATYTIGKLAKVGGVHIQTIRYYERRKLLAPASRLPSGYRLYDNDALKRLGFIKNAQRLGFTLREIDGLLNLRVKSGTQCRDVQVRASTKLATVEAKIRDLEALARALQSLISACRNGRRTDDCPILSSLEMNHELNDLAQATETRSTREPARSPRRRSRKP